MSKNVFRKIKEVKEVVNCFLANADVEEDNVVIDNQHKDEVIVFNDDFSWNWSNHNGLTLHIWDAENKIDIPLKSVKEDEDDFDRLYTKDYLLTIL